ncbi:hypothetical protein BJX70DRAFT_378706 [Aspergillus crustosus]
MTPLFFSQIHSISHQSSSHLLSKTSCPDSFALRYENRPNIARFISDRQATPKNSRCRPKSQPKTTRPTMFSLAATMLLVLVSDCPYWNRVSLTALRLCWDVSCLSLI